MKQDQKIIKSSFLFVKEGSWGWKAALCYDIIMMVFIVLNLIVLATDTILMSEYAIWFFNFIQLPEFIPNYKDHVHPWVMASEAWFTLFLIIELLIRWWIAIIYKHHQRWFFFPFVHWYEILAILPQFRFLRLFRAVAIAYNLHRHGYTIIPETWYARGNFYYHLIMEELTSRIVLTVLNGIRHELKTSTTHKKLIEELVNHHREMLALTLTDILQENLGKELQQQRHLIAKNVGQVVNKAIEDTPELSQMLRLIPLVGGRIEQQIQSIGQRLGENIAQGLIEPFSQQTHDPDNELYALISKKISEIAIEQNPYIDKLVESAVFESLEAIRQQVKVKQWQDTMQQRQQAKEET